MWLPPKNSHVQTPEPGHDGKNLSSPELETALVALFGEYSRHSDKLAFHGCVGLSYRPNCALSAQPEDTEEIPPPPPANVKVDSPASPIVLFDLETTGRCAQECVMTQIAAMHMDTGEAFNQYVVPMKKHHTRCHEGHWCVNSNGKRQKSAGEEGRNCS